MQPFGQKNGSSLWSDFLRLFSKHFVFICWSFELARLKKSWFIRQTRQVGWIEQKIRKDSLHSCGRPLDNCSKWAWCNTIKPPLRKHLKPWDACSTYLRQFLHRLRRMRSSWTDYNTNWKRNLHTILIVNSRINKLSPCPLIAIAYFPEIIYITSRIFSI